MAEVPIRHRQNRNVNLTTFTDELHSDVGSAAFILADLKEACGHDYFSGEDLDIWTGAGGTGTNLIVNTHYTLSEENSTYSTLASNAAGSTKTIYLKIQITDATYQTGDLYFSGKYWGDRADTRDLANITLKIVDKTADYTITNLSGNQIISMTAGATDKTIFLPDPAENVDQEITGILADNAAGNLVFDFNTVGGSTGNGSNTVTVYSQYDIMTWKSTGSDWRLINKHTNIILDSAALATSQIQTLAHGLGTKPTIIEAVLLCVTGEHGYTAGDETNPISPFSSTSWITYSADATNIITYTGSVTGVVAHKTTGVASNMTMANWKLRFKYVAQ